MIIGCLSDLHGNLVEVPDCDLVILAGDLCPLGTIKFQSTWLNDEFRTWLEGLQERKIQVVGIAGNHDEVFAYSPGLVPELPWTYLEDEGYNEIWGTPWSLIFGPFPFMQDEEYLDEKYSKIPDNTKIIISHSPPYGFGDLVKGKSRGSFALLNAIERIKPKLVVCGHLHENAGIYYRGNTIIVNASLVNDAIEVVNNPIVIEI